MAETIQEPQQKISPAAVKMWWMEATIENLIIFCVLVVLLFLQQYYDWVEWIGIILYILLALTVLSAIFEIGFYPNFRIRVWRYEVDERFVQIKRGAINQKYLIVPMTKVQYVNTIQGPLLRKFGLATIKIGTMASTHEIPAVAEQEAEALRTRIAVLAEVTESDEEEGVASDDGCSASSALPRW